MFDTAPFSAAAPVSDAKRRAIRDSVARVGRLSDGLLRLGPLNLGLDGVLSWIPGVGEVYSGAAAAFILIQGARAEVPGPTLALAGALLACRTTITAIPLAGPAAADLFTAHRWAAAMIVRAIDRRLEGAPPGPHPKASASRATPRGDGETGASERQDPPPRSGGGGSRGARDGGGVQA